MASVPTSPPDKPKKPWYTRWWVWVLAAVLVIGAVATSADSDPDETAASGAATDTADAAERPSDAEREAESAAPVETAPADWFDVQTYAGRGDDLIDLPAGAPMGVVTAAHHGTANFIVEVLDTANESTGDLLVNEIGTYAGTTLYGRHGWGGAPATLAISADGEWEITITHPSDAPLLDMPAAGRGDSVWRYDDGKGKWRISHDGSSNFVVYVEGPLMGLLVNEIGAYEGTVAVTDEVRLVVIEADGDWTISSAD